MPMLMAFTARSDPSSGGGGGTTDPDTGLPLLFSDDFESGGLTHTENGIAWGSATNIAVTTDNANGGTHAAKFTFAGTADGNDATAELRFDLGAVYTQIVLQMDMYIPNGLEGYGGAAYAHRNDSPNNNKMFRLWRGDKTDGNDGYSTFYSKFGASTLHSATGISSLIAEYGKDQLGVGETGNGSDPDAGHQDPFISSGDLGTWITRKHYCKSATAANNDGALKQWRNGTLVTSVTNLPQYPSGGASQNGVNFGYLLGFSDSGFTSTTYIFLDNVKIFGS